MKRLLWVAGANGIAHARRLSSSPRSLCDAPAIPERLSYPAERRCVICELRAEKAAAA